MSDRSPPSDDNVIRFRPRDASPSGWRWPVPRRRRDDTPVADLSRYERAPPDDDYRHRMKINALAFVATAILIVIGVWLAVSIADLRKNQDCVLMGRPNCAQVKIPPAER
jgi:hypothetical protein